MVISRPVFRRFTTRSAAAVAGISLLAGACAGGSSGGEQAAETPAVAAERNAENQSAATEPDGPQPTAAEADAPASDGSASDAVDPSDATAPDPDSSQGESETEREADPSLNELADVEVIDVATGDPVNLKSFAPADKPIVLWFWAPH